MKTFGTNFFSFLYGITFVIGTVGNLFCFMVYSRKNFKKISKSFYFKAMSINDILILLHELRHFIRSTSGFDMKTTADFSCKLVSYLTFTTISVSPWIKVYVLFDLFISIKYYKKFEQRNTLKFKQLVIFCIYLTSFSIYIPIAILRNKITHDDNDFNHTIELAKCGSREYKEFLSILDIFYSALLPFFLMIFFTLVLTILIFQSKNRLKNRVVTKYYSCIRKDIQFALTAIGLNFLFLLTNLPAAFIEFFSGAEEKSWFKLLDNLVYINAALKFFIYFSINKMFQNECMDMLRLHFKIGTEIQNRVTS